MNLSTTQGDEEKELTFERKVVRKVGTNLLKKQNGEYERQKNKQTNI